MAYASNYYNYQVGVIFAILVGALLLLALIVGAIYYICVVNMRDKKGRASRTPSSVRQPRTSWHPSQQPQPVPYSSLHSPAVQPQPADYGPRSPGYPAQYTAQYNPQPLVQQYSSDFSSGVKVRELQPEFTYQQGPVTYTTMSPVQDGPYPVSPGPAGAATYHMSSV